ncbi:MAG: hypothetical protein ACRDKL_06495 [Solirubrobacteraceae bacterium]
MGSDETPSLELDLVAASLRADLDDLGSFVEGLAVKLEGSLPGMVQVERVKQGFRGPKLVRRIALDAGPGERLELRRDGQRVETLRARTSGGIVLRTEQLDTEAWLTALSAAMVAEAGRNERTRIALQSLLLAP